MTTPCSGRVVIWMRWMFRRHLDLVHEAADVVQRHVPQRIVDAPQKKRSNSVGHVAVDGSPVTPDLLGRPPARCRPTRCNGSRGQWRPRSRFVPATANRWRAVAGHYGPDPAAGRVPGIERRLRARAALRMHLACSCSALSACREYRVGIKRTKRRLRFTRTCKGDVVASRHFGDGRGFPVQTGGCPHDRCALQRELSELGDIVAGPTSTG